jgi:hypothetical protein
MELAGLLAVNFLLQEFISIRRAESGTVALCFWGMCSWRCSSNRVPAYLAVSCCVRRRCDGMGPDAVGCRSWELEDAGGGNLSPLLCLVEAGKLRKEQCSIMSCAGVGRSAATPRDLNLLGQTKGHEIFLRFFLYDSFYVKNIFVHSIYRRRRPNSPLCGLFDRAGTARCSCCHLPECMRGLALSAGLRPVHPPWGQVGEQTWGR